MKYLSFLKGDVPHLGILIEGDRVVDATSFLQSEPNSGLGSVPRDVSGLIPLGNDVLDRLAKLATDAKASSSTLPKLDEIAVLAPLSPNKNIFCVGRNYREHIIEGNLARGVPAHTFPEAVEFFTKPPTSVIGHGADVWRHGKLTDSLDYEVELAIVIGRRGTNISRDDALDYVFGYTVLNDITARDLQKRHGQWFKGKGLDTTCPIGPVVVHRSAISDVNNLDLSLTVNGVLRQSDNTSSMIFDVESIIEQLSTGMTLEPGDVIATGTPKGVGFAMSPPACLEVGDEVAATIEQIGTLINTVVA